MVHVDFYFEFLELSLELFFINCMKMTANRTLFLIPSENYYSLKLDSFFFFIEIFKFTSDEEKMKNKGRD